MGDPAFFESWCFGADRDSVIEMASNRDDWSEWVDDVVANHGIRKNTKNST